MATIRIGSAVSERGEISFGSFPAGKLADSTPVEVPVIIVNGTKDGPTLMLSAALHGPEIMGTEIIRRICREIVDPETLRGSIVALPIANPYGYRSASWINVEDGFNVNRAFPGDADGWLTGRLAHALIEHAIKHADFVIDIHGMCDPSIFFSIVKQASNSAVYEKSMDLAVAFGLPIVVSQVPPGHHRAGAMLGAAAEMGIPGVTPELQRWRRIEPQAVKIGTRGTLNVMRHLGMLEGSIEVQDPPHNGIPSPFRLVDIFSNEGGLVEFPLEIGEVVRKGDIIARIRNPFGDVVEDITSPVDGFLVGYPLFNNQAVRTGEMLVFIGAPIDV